jgi:hypothetical protein
MKPKKRYLSKHIAPVKYIRKGIDMSGYNIQEMVEDRENVETGYIRRYRDDK